MMWDPCITLGILSQVTFYAVETFHKDDIHTGSMCGGLRMEKQCYSSLQTQLTVDEKVCDCLLHKHVVASPFFRLSLADVTFISNCLHVLQINVFLIHLTQCLACVSKCPVFIGGRNKNKPVDNSSCAWYPQHHEPGLKIYSALEVLLKQ